MTDSTSSPALVAVREALRRRIDRQSTPTYFFSRQLETDDSVSTRQVGKYVQQIADGEREFEGYVIDRYGRNGSTIRWVVRRE